MDADSPDQVHALWMICMMFQKLKDDPAYRQVAYDGLVDGTGAGVDRQELDALLADVWARLEGPFDPAWLLKHAERFSVLRVHKEMPTPPGLAGSELVLAQQEKTRGYGLVRPPDGFRRVLRARRLAHEAEQAKRQPGPEGTDPC